MCTNCRSHACKRAGPTGDSEKKGSVIYEKHEADVGLPVSCSESVVWDSAQKWEKVGDHGFLSPCASRAAGPAAERLVGFCSPRF